MKANMAMEAGATVVHGVEVGVTAVHGVAAMVGEVHGVAAGAVVMVAGVEAGVVVGLKNTVMLILMLNLITKQEI